MFAALATHAAPDDPLSALRLGEHPDPQVPPGWTLVRLKAMSLNHHDLWTLRGVGVAADRFPIVLGCDGAGVTADGVDVVLHAVIGDPSAGDGDETLDPRMSLLSERYDGTLAELVVVPRRNLVPKPPELSWTEAACLPTAWLTAYRMLVVRGGARPGDRVLVQGAGGGVATAAIALARAAGCTVYVTGRDQTKLDRARELGAHVTVGAGEKLPDKVDLVLETVGEATWAHSLRALRPGGRVVVSGATSGAEPPADLRRVFYRQLSVVGSTMGTRGELVALTRMLAATGLRPTIDGTWSLGDAAGAFARLAGGQAFGKVCVSA